MKIKTLFPPACLRFGGVLAASLLLALALSQSGCATRKQVADIVAQSNGAMLASQFGLPEAKGATTKGSWEESSDRLEAFIAAHPDHPATTAPLRIRQAMLLLSYRQFSLAEAAFNAAVIEHLHTDRDQALKRIQATLLWWFANSTNAAWSAVDQTQAQLALRQLKQEQARLVASPDIRDYLAEMRAWIALAAAKQTTDTNAARGLIEEALDVYATAFTAEDLVILAAGQEQRPDPKALGPDVRRRLRARAVLAEARERNKNNGLGAHPTTAYFNQAINQ
jgi:hypothetical protein